MDTRDELNALHRSRGEQEMAPIPMGPIDKEQAERSRRAFLERIKQSIREFEALPAEERRALAQAMLHDSRWARRA